MNAEYENVLDDHPGKLHFTFVNTWDQLLPAHWHEHLEIVYVTGGAITASINDVSYELKKGDIFLVNSNDIHYTYTHEDARYFLLQIPPVHLERVSPRWNSLKFQEFIPGESEDGEKNRNMVRACLNSQMAEIFHEIDGLYQEKRRAIICWFWLLFIACCFFFTQKESEQRKRLPAVTGHCGIWSG